MDGFLTEIVSLDGTRVGLSDVDFETSRGSSRPFRYRPPRRMNERAP
jgi:hypothetical protein